MYKRPLRFDLPAADMMLQVLNFTNKTAFEKHQLTFGKPSVVTDETHGIVPDITNDYDLHRPTVGTLTKIEVKPTPITGWTKSQWLLYRRKIIQDHFISVPFVIYGKEATKEVVLKALHEQYRLFLDADLCDVEFTAIDLNEVLFQHHMGSIVENSCGDYIPPAAFNAVVKIRPEHPYWMGEFPVYIREAVEFLDRDIKNTLEINRYLGPGDHAKIPAEMMLKITGFVDKDYYVRGLKEGALVGKMILDVAKDLTRDPWVFEDKPAPFNLYGTTVVHNGTNTGELYIGDPRVSNVMVLQFSEEFCTNIRGQWVFGYYNGETFLRRQRIDALPIQDQ
jgi:hypothetical protein